MKLTRLLNIQIGTSLEFSYIITIPGKNTGLKAQAEAMATISKQPSVREISLDGKDSCILS